MSPAASTSPPSRTGARERPIPSQALWLKELGSRWLVAHLMLNNARGRKVPLEELGKELADELGELDPIPITTMHRSARGKREPSGREIEAFCRILRRAGVDIDPGWLSHGAESRAPEPTGPLLAAAPLL